MKQTTKIRQGWQSRPSIPLGAASLLSGSVIHWQVSWLLETESIGEARNEGEKKMGFPSLLGFASFQNKQLHSHEYPTTSRGRFDV